MTLSFSIEGIIEMGAAANEAIDLLSQDLSHVVVAAGDEAVAEMQRNHPYQDRTYNLSGGMRCRLGRRSRWRAEAVVDFTAFYAGYVNDGTSRNRPYPFVPNGLRAAEPVLQREMESALDRFAAHFGGG